MGALPIAVSQRASSSFTPCSRPRRHRQPPAPMAGTSPPNASSSASSIPAWIEGHLDVGKVTGEPKFAGGSGWSSAYVYDTSSGRKLFIKTARGRGPEAMFRGEAEGLRAMYATRALRIPDVYHYGELPGAPGGGSWICMEYLDMRGRAEPAALGRALAHMHLATPLDPQAAAGKFGFSCDNTIGGTPQPNGWMDEWIPFFRERRLAHQLRLASNARLSRLAEPVLDNMERFFEGVEEPIRPALIHGDLWSGNIAAVDGEPTVFDPACCFGHSEAEFGMSWCAGFSPAFYSTYHELIPRAEGWDDRHDLYQLYHFLNHFNLFGSGYLGQCEQTLERLARKL